MLSFLREAAGADGKPGPLSMRRLAAAACIIASIASAVFALVVIFKFISGNPNTTIDWKAFIPLFIPCLAFLVGTLALLFFTTWEDIKAAVHAVAELKGKQ
jgi:hypothetical protein